ncbi:MAG: aminotransferase class III-fold pyridoxal phosphate-dependent enzyme [Candidatus Rokubacteria bacterium]|nr:aminotransferase class III-fold pyridoxal phosphate-dependent enzyme [Candidatus Rokubacteria bacterium]MBI2014203.1 aminotransferase class III-fold pyridoxal phosphate-dependent enzyme [Candidatus Rokubacteria bacterium]MBI4255352.1 aminotransferase class III-fold pyridoxal phosphate-dependent enzyme [Candidatus Rokubacteria bacterium]
MMRSDQRLEALVPAGCHTYSKGRDQFPPNVTGLAVRGKGVRLWMDDGAEYLDWGMGLRTALLGYAHDEVDAAAIEAIRNGQNLTRPGVPEKTLAERLVTTFPEYEMFKFAKSGSDVTAAAVRLARAHTGRNTIAMCEKDFFYSYHDWFIGSTVADAGIPAFNRRLSLKFPYNDFKRLLEMVETSGDVAAIILEPVNDEEPEDFFLQRVRELCDRKGIVLIFDEMITGFRYAYPSVQRKLGVYADLATFGKAIGNGYSVAVLAGKRDIMEHGAIGNGRRRVFLMSATHGAEHSALAAGAKVLELLAGADYAAYHGACRRFVDGIAERIRRHGLDDRCQVRGLPFKPAIAFASDVVKTYFYFLLAEQRVMMPYIAQAFAHSEADVRATHDAIDRALGELKATPEAKMAAAVGDAVLKPVFRPYN